MRNSKARYEAAPISMESRIRQGKYVTGIEVADDGWGQMNHASLKPSTCKRGLGSMFFALPQEEFLERLRIEKRRAERAKSALSIVLLSFDQARQYHNGNIVEVLNFLGRHLRETDIIGFAKVGTIGVLLPDTEDAGMQHIVQKIHDGLDGCCLSLASGTYPNQLFENLLGREADRPKVIPLVLQHPYPYPLFKLRIKRIVDVVVAVIGMVVFFPVMLLTAVAIKLTSRGPVVFRQTRLGKSGVPFTFYKFRSMRVDSDDAIHRQYVRSLISGDKDINQGEEEAPLYKLASDPRVTKIGRFIRKTSIDELPQFFNVLKGEMSLVGPRPPLPYEIESYDAWHLRRILDMKPGITGLWQVEGRSKTTFDEAVRLDVRYIENWSLWLDISLLIRTVRVVLKCDGAL